MENKIITIDGPTSSGKNSVGLALAQKLNYQYIDSGSIYRAGCILLLRNKVPIDNLEKVVDVFKDMKVKVQNDGNFKFFLNNEDVTEELHNPDITKLVPVVSAIREVREVTKVIQHNLAEGINTVMTGRDIGSEIFSDAKHKFFLTADVEVRAKRRYEQLKETDSTIKYEDVLADMKDRDEKDTTREVSPLRIPEGAVVIDNSNLTVKQTVEEMLKHIHA